jgi:MATE family multidrug resistance protein
MLSLSGYYIFGIPLGVFFAFKLQYGLQGLWMGLTLALVYCAVLGTWLCLRTDWDREVQKVQDRLREEDKRRKVVSEA